MKKNDIYMLWRHIFAVTDGLRSLRRSVVGDKEVRRLTLNQLRMIQAVWQLTYDDRDEGITLKQLVEKLGITAAAGSEMVDSLVRKNVLNRTQNRQDRRSLSLCITPEWLRRFETSEAGFTEITERFIKTLDVNEQEELITLAGRFSEFIDDERHKVELKQK